MNISQQKHLQQRAADKVSARNKPRAPVSRHVVPLVACLATLLGLPVQAAVVMPETPIQTNNGVPPNIWFILDDSGSMAWDFMPGALNSSEVPATTPNAIQLQTYARNTLYYNPYTEYDPWMNATGGRLTDTPYNAVYSSTTLASGGTIDLRSNTRTFYVPTATNTNLADSRQYTRYQLQTDGVTVRKCDWSTGTGSYSVCTNITGSTLINWGGISRTAAQEFQNFATWYSFYRTRTKVAKGGASEAFNDPTVFNTQNLYRVGFTTIWQRNEYRIPVGNDNGLFRNTNRSDWFTRLHNAGANDGTPLLPALNRAGDYFTETGTGGPWGPQAGTNQYACRQNFTILTTDGYWNSGTTAVGNADNTSGPVHSPPVGSDVTPLGYTPAAPYRDSVSNTLADIAMAFWKSDLRSDLDNIVPISAANPAFWQHMTTFGISIGLRGNLDPVADMDALKAGTLGWPDPTDAEDADRIDDLFHASVNGHGKFISANNPAQFADGLGSVLRSINERNGSGSNASVASTSTSAGTKMFAAQYFSRGWYGRLESFPVSSTGVGATRLWEASIPASGRDIFTFRATSSPVGTTFPTSAQVTALTSDVANYIAGDRSKEGTDTGKLRPRTSLLGDIVNSSPTYVKTSGTVDTVYVGANDGMLHAFDATSGVERFAYVPRGVSLTNLRNYSDPDYNHHFFVDGPVVVSSERVLANRRILVGTLGRGGRGLFALDVTDPENFDGNDVLWDHDGTASDQRYLGQIIGKPVIAKLNNGALAVIVPNGLNSPGTTASNGERASLFIFDLLTGNLIKEINTGQGSPSNSNGLSSPRAWDNDGNGTVDLVYAGDLHGNLWKFDLNNTNANQWNATRLYQPTSGLPQPITGGVSVAFDPVTFKRWVFFGTGSLLTNTDLLDTSRQTWYGIRDDGVGNYPRRRSDLTAREIISVGGFTADGPTLRAFEPNAAMPTDSNGVETTRGWYIDLDMPPSNTLEGERMVGEPQVVASAMISPSIIPNTSNPCRPGRGYINAVDAFTGTSLSTSLFDSNRDGKFDDLDTLGSNKVPVGSIDLGIGMVTDPAVLDKLLVAGGSLAKTGSVPIRNPTRSGRISWREVIRR